uniref:Uncharacterized protein n=1 Tax=Oryza rufipogon TaxID=4529 RepID=A0A0E0MX43_ORYRU
MHLLPTKRTISLVVEQRRRWLHRIPRTMNSTDAQHFGPPSRLASALWKLFACGCFPDPSESHLMRCFPPIAQRMKFASC